MSKFVGFILIFGAQIVAGHYVIELTDRNFHGALKKYESLMVDFYATWCGHCKNFKPTYEAASVQVHDRGMESVLARIDAYTYQEIKKEWKIGGYPTILYYQNGTLVEKYPGRRTVDEIVQYLSEQEGIDN